MTTFNHRGTTINKIDLTNFQEELDFLGLDFMSVWMELGDGETDFIYVSNGFLGLLNNPENMTDGEWHHFFKKNNDGTFEACKFQFNDRVSTYGL